jgi:uncharacterized phage protein gp47/JayE
MPKGLSATGFDLKRLPDVLEEQRTLAASIFQDLVGVNDIVDTSDSSTIGRFINLFSPASAALWEQAQLLYSAFDPNTATDVALDNLVQYGGISRNKASAALTVGVFKGDYGTTIPLGSVVGSNVSPFTFETLTPIILDTTSVIGWDLEINTVSESSVYSFTYSLNSVTTNSVSYTSVAGATVASIQAAIKAIVDSSHPLLIANIIGSTLTITKVDLSQKSNITFDPKFTLTKVTKSSTMVSQKVGVVSAESNSLNVIKTPVLGWDSVTNPNPSTGGRDVETDEELRLKFRNTKFERSSNLLDSLYSALLNLEGVDSLAVYENDTEFTDANGLTPHSYMVVILGGEEQKIAETIWKNKPYGISASVGLNASADIVDSQGFPRTIFFERPTPVTVYVTIDLTTSELVPADGEDQIRSAIIQYAKEEFSVGDDVVYSRLYTPINSIIGHQVNSLAIGTSPSPVGVSNITVAFNQISSFQSINIVITS